jgi:hypothetical protein
METKRSARTADGIIFAEPGTFEILGVSVAVADLFGDDPQAQ